MSEKDKKKLIYKSAFKLFWKKWPKKVSIDMIIKGAGVWKGTFYNYFKNKEDLYEQMIESILSEGSIMMTYLHENIPDVKERFLQHMIWMIKFFERNVIIKSIFDWNVDYFCWCINEEYLYKKHLEFMRILLWKDFKNDESFIYTIAHVKWFYIEVSSKRNHFKNVEKFEEFALNLAAIMIQWLFSDYDKLIKGREFADFAPNCSKLQINKLNKI